MKIPEIYNNKLCCKSIIMFIQDTFSTFSIYLLEFGAEQYKVAHKWKVERWYVIFSIIYKINLKIWFALISLNKT